MRKGRNQRKSLAVRSAAAAVLELAETCLCVRHWLRQRKMPVCRNGSLFRDAIHSWMCLIEAIG
ncbi:MAG: hypothetical protein LBU32_18625 [Clostridiales bacterium]|jgi:hypothetical protein|nr:hypothetical protein [Clostridiales bacterium]